MTKYIVLCILLLNANIFANQAYYSYEMFNKKLAVVLPDTPILILENPYIMYAVADKDESHSFSIQMQTMPFEYDVGKYKQGTKSSLDKSIRDSLKIMNFRLLDFSSSFKKNENTYTAIYYAESIESGVHKYMATKYIIHGKILYKWSVISNDVSHRVFKSYENSVNIIK